MNRDERVMQQARRFGEGLQIDLPSWYLSEAGDAGDNFLQVRPSDLGTTMLHARFAKMPSNCGMLIVHDLDIRDEPFISKRKDAAIFADLVRAFCYGYGAMYALATMPAENPYYARARGLLRHWTVIDQFYNLNSKSLVNVYKLDVEKTSDRTCKQLGFDPYWRE